MDELRVSAHLQDNYDRYYEDGSSEWRWLEALDKAANIVALCKRLPHDSILEIGAGEGAVLQRLSEFNFGKELYALEISPTGIEAIKKRGIPRLIDCSLFDGYNVPYEKGELDIVVLTHVVEHLEHPRRLLHEAGRVAKHVFIEVPLEDTVRLPADFVHDRVGHINFYRPKTIRRLVQTCNLEVLEQKVTNPSKAVHAFQGGRKGIVKYYIRECLLRLLPRLATRIFAYHSALVCRDVERKQTQQ